MPFTVNDYSVQFSIELKVIHRIEIFIFHILQWKNIDISRRKWLIQRISGHFMSALVFRSRKTRFLFKITMCYRKNSISRQLRCFWSEKLNLGAKNLVPVHEHGLPFKFTRNYSQFGWKYPIKLGNIIKIQLEYRPFIDLCSNFTMNFVWPNRIHSIKKHGTLSLNIATHFLSFNPIWNATFHMKYQ